MTIQTENAAVAQQDTNGVTTLFTFPNRVLAASDLKVSMTNKTTGAVIPLVLNTDYSVAGVGGNSADISTIGVQSPWVTGYRFTAEYAIPATQTADYTDNDPFPAQTHEGALDKLTLLVQQLKSVVTRSLQFPSTDNLAGLVTLLPAAAIRAGKLLGFDNVGNIVLSTTDTDNVIAAQAARDTAVAAAAAAALSAASLPKNNYGATTNPTVANDSSQGYAAGSRWINVTGPDAYTCLNPAVGAAVWQLDTLTSAETLALITGVIYGKQSLWISAAYMKPSATAGAQYGSYEATTNKGNYDTLDFDPATRQNAEFSIAMPKSWDKGTISVQYFWKTTDTTTNAVIWGTEIVSIGDNETLDVAYGTAVTVTDAVQSNANRLLVSVESGAITAGGTPANDEMLHVRVYRDAAAGGDTSAVSSSLVGIKFNFTNNAGNDT